MYGLTEEFSFISSSKLGKYGRISTSHTLDTLKQANGLILKLFLPYVAALNFLRCRANRHPAFFYQYFLKQVKF
jgi:hypothetical protein